MNRRTTIPYKLRQVLLRSRCHYCGGKSTRIEHLTPLWAGGTNDKRNLKGVCRDCAIKKDKLEAKLRRLDRKPVKGMREWMKRLNPRMIP